MDYTNRFHVLIKILLLGYYLFVLVNVVSSGDPTCPSNIKSCYNCEVEGGCLVNEYLSISEEECINYLSTQEIIWSVEYNYDSGTCRESNCEDVKIRYKEGKVIHRKTCDTEECADYTVTMEEKKKVSLSQNASVNVKGPKDWECLSHCLSTNTACSISYNPSEEHCLVYTECQGLCPTYVHEQGSWHVYTKSCGNTADVVSSGDPTCPSNIKSCYNCEVELEADCLENEYNTVTEEECINYLSTQLIIWSVEYNYNSGTCRESKCEDVKIRYTEGKVIHMKTCDTDECADYTVTMEEKKKVSLSQNASVNVTGLRDWECLSHCLSTKTACSISYNPSEEHCLVYTECQGLCPTYVHEQGTWHVYTKSCGNTGTTHPNTPEPTTTVHPSTTPSQTTTSETTTSQTTTLPTTTSQSTTSSSTTSQTTTSPTTTSQTTTSPSTTSQTTTTPTTTSQTTTSLSTTSQTSTSPTTTSQTTTSPSGTSKTTTSQTTTSQTTASPSTTSQTTTTPTTTSQTTTSQSTTSLTTTTPTTTSQTLPTTTSQTTTSPTTISQTTPLYIKIEKLYIAPCICYTNKTFANMTQEEVIAYLVKDTQIDTKNTALAQSKLSCKNDPRPSSSLIGTCSLIILCVLAGLMVCCDGITIISKWRTTNSVRPVNY